MKRKIYNVIEEIEVIKKKINYFSTKNKELIKQFLSILKEGNEEKDHNKGKNPFIQIYKGTKNFIDISNDVIINLSKKGDVEIINLNKIDFTGKIIIL